MRSGVSAHVSMSLGFCVFPCAFSPTWNVLCHDNAFHVQVLMSRCRRSNMRNHSWQEKCRIKLIVETYASIWNAVPVITPSLSFGASCFQDTIFVTESAFIKLIVPSSRHTCLLTPDHQEILKAASFLRMTRPATLSPHTYIPHKHMQTWSNLHTDMLVCKVRHSSCAHKHANLPINLSVYLPAYQLAYLPPCQHICLQGRTNACLQMAWKGFSKACDVTKSYVPNQSSMFPWVLKHATFSCGDRRREVYDSRSSWALGTLLPGGGKPTKQPNSQSSRYLGLGDVGWFCWEPRDFNELKVLQGCKTKLTQGRFHT